MRHYVLAIILVFSFHLPTRINGQQADFLVKPYLQIGKSPSPQSLQLLWHAAFSNDVWLAEYKNSGANEWMKADNQASSKIAVAGIEPFTVYSASFKGLVAGSKFMYRVSKNGKVVFSADAKALKSPAQSYRVDCR